MTYGFWLNFVVTGGAGITLSLIFAIFLFSKREDHRMIAKLSFLPGLCGISEPIVFGLPLVLNPTFAIPFIFNSGISTAIAMFATSIGFLPCNTVDVPFGRAGYPLCDYRTRLAGSGGTDCYFSRLHLYLGSLCADLQQAGRRRGITTQSPESKRGVFDRLI